MTEVRSPFSRRLRSVDEQAGPALPRSVAGGYGVVPAAQVDTGRPVPAPRALSPKEADRLMQGELLQVAASLRDSTTALTARLGDRHGAVNGVLLVRYVALDADGQWQYAAPVTIGSAVVEHVDPAAPKPVYVIAGGGAATLPGTGATGVQRVQPGREKKLPVGGHVLQVWGDPGAVINVQLYTGLQPFGVGL